jgi:hypothetical protein
VEICDAGSEMSVATTAPMKQRPTHPGEMLREDFLRDFGLTVGRAGRRARGLAAVDLGVAAGPPPMSRWLTHSGA